MVCVEKSNSEAVTFDTQFFDSESFEAEVENQMIAADKRKLNFVPEKSVMTVFVAYMNFGSDCALDIVDISI